MNKTPKKIWISTFIWSYHKTEKTETPYIRADLVDDLVEALEDLIKGGESMGWESAIKVIAALKALEEE